MTEVSVSRAPLLAAGRRQQMWGALWFLPLMIFSLIFLFLPSIGLFAGSVAGRHGPTLTYYADLFQAQYLDAYKVSIELSAATAVIGALAGLLLAWAVVGGGLPRVLRPLTLTFSGVASNFAGIPLAFAFTSTLGPVGLVTLFLKSLHLNLYAAGFSLFGFWGLVVTYLYFQIPLMVLLIVPALDHLHTWREAAMNLGATPLQFWRYVALPILRLPMLGALMLLFGNSFGAYATAYALTSGMINLVPILIGQELSGNVVFSPNLADAMAVGMVLIMVAIFVVYIVANRRSVRWQA
ncbi:MAG: ABC transporter permease subunit [Firmicutes bacterium]|nr:ABC transporter permease subunit [Bacillota bacterium]